MLKEMYEDIAANKLSFTQEAPAAIPEDCTLRIFFPSIWCSPFFIFSWSFRSACCQAAGAADESSSTDCAGMNLLITIFGSKLFICFLMQARQAIARLKMGLAWLLTKILWFIFLFFCEFRFSSFFFIYFIHFYLFIYFSSRFKIVLVRVSVWKACSKVSNTSQRATYFSWHVRSQFCSDIYLVSYLRLFFHGLMLRLILGLLVLF